MLSRRTWIFVALALLVVVAAGFLGLRAQVSAAPPEQPQAQVVREITELRSETSKTFELSDGNREWVGYAEAVHYKDADGTFQDIDSSVVGESREIDGVNYGLRNAANAYTARFAVTGDSAYLVNIEYQGKSIAFGPVGAQASDVARTASAPSKALEEISYGENLVAYPEVFPGIDLLYEPKTYGVKEYLLLKEVPAQNEFTFDFLLSGLTAKEVDGRIILVDEQGEPVFWLGEPLALDDNGIVTKDISYDLSEEAGGCRLTVTVSRAFLEDPERAYPVVVDPEIIITGTSVTSDSFVSSLYPNNNYYLSTYVRTGYYTDYGIRRTFIKFDLSGATGFWPEEVTAAYLRMEKYGGSGTPQVAGYRVTGSWSSSTITWNNKPGYSTANPSAYAYNDSGSWWRMDCATMVKSWLAGTYSNYGFCVKDHYEDGSRWTHWYSSDAPSPHKPELHIVYTSWTYCYDQYDGAGGWQHSQSTTNSAKNWSGSCYYRFHNSMSSTFRNSVYAAVDTWSAQDPNFHFYELPMGGNPEDHVLNMLAMDPQRVAVVQGVSVWLGGGMADVGDWHMHFNTAITWCNGAFPDQHDRQSVATHEFGHTIRLMDLPGSWSDASASKPTMASWGSNTTGRRSLASGDITGITKLY